MRPHFLALVTVTTFASFGSVVACGGAGETLFNNGEGGEGGSDTTGGKSGASGNAGSAQGGASGASGASGTSGASGKGGVGGTLGVGGTQAVGGTNPVGGASGVTGTGGVPGPCNDSDMSTDPVSPLKTRGTTTGTNGSFEDTCDQTANLVEHSCETSCIGGPFPPGTGGTGAGMYPRIACLPQPTGRVIEAIVNCGGRCVEGSCFQWCPSPEDMLTVESVNGAEVRLRSVSDYNYRCSVSWQKDGYNCIAPSLAGRQVRIVGGSCTVDVVTMAMDDGENGPDEDCALQCTWE